MLGEAEASRIALLWSVMFVIISVIYRPIEQLLSRTIAERRARGQAEHPLRVPMAIQAGFALTFLVIALAFEEQIVNDVFDHDQALYDVLVFGTLAYAGSYFARGWLAGHEYFALYGGLVLMESISRLCFALAVALGIASGQTAVALGIAAAPLVSLIVVPAAFARRGRERREAAGEEPAVHAADAALAGPITADEADAALAGPGTEGVQEAVAHDELSLRRGTGFAGWVSGIMLSEQTLLNAAVLTVAATAADKALVGVVFDVLLIARAPLQLFQAIQTSLLPHLTGLETTAGHEAFARAIRITVLAIAAFAAAVALALLAIGPFVMGHLFGQHYSYGRARPGRGGRGDGPAPGLGSAQPGGARAQPGARGGALLGACRVPVPGLDADARGRQPAHAHRDRLRRRDRAAGAAAVDALPAGLRARSRWSLLSPRPASARSPRRRRPGRASRRSPSRRRTRSRRPRGSPARWRGRCRRPPRPRPPRRRSRARAGASAASAR